MSTPHQERLHTVEHIALLAEWLRRRGTNKHPTDPASHAATAMLAEPAGVLHILEEAKMFDVAIRWGSGDLTIRPRAPQVLPPHNHPHNHQPYVVAVGVDSMVVQCRDITCTWEQVRPTTFPLDPSKATPTLEASYEKTTWYEKAAQSAPPDEVDDGPSPIAR